MRFVTVYKRDLESNSHWVNNTKEYRFFLYTGSRKHTPESLTMCTPSAGCTWSTLEHLKNNTDNIHKYVFLHIHSYIYFLIAYKCRHGSTAQIIAQNSYNLA